MEKENLALEMLRELKAQSKRWFIIAIIELVIIIATTGIFVWYINQPIEETITTEEQTIEDIDNSTNSNYTQTIN